MYFGSLLWQDSVYIALYWNGVSRAFKLVQFVSSPPLKQFVISLEDLYFYLLMKTTTSVQEINQRVLTKKKKVHLFLGMLYPCHPPIFSVGYLCILCWHPSFNCLFFTSFSYNRGPITFKHSVAQIPFGGLAGFYENRWYHTSRLNILAQVFDFLGYDFQRSRKAR